MGKMEAASARAFFWEAFPPMPTCRVYCSPTYQDGHLFVVGGCSQQGQPLGTVEMLDIVSRKWMAFPPMATPRAGAAAVMSGKQMLVVGGVDSIQSPLASVEVYHMDEGKWEKAADLAQASMGISAVEREFPPEELMDNDETMLEDSQELESNESHGLQEIDNRRPMTTQGQAQVDRGIAPQNSPSEPSEDGTDGAVYALGGMGTDTSPQALVQMYEPTKDHWQPLPSMPTPCYGASTFLHGNKIYVMGGRQGKLPVTAFEAFDLEVKSWTRYPSMPSRRAFASCAMADGCFFSLGGLQQPGPHNFYSRPHFVNTVEMFDLEAGSWSRLSRAIRMRDKRADFVAGCLGGRVVAVGGLGNQSSPLGSVEGFNLTKKKWEPLPSMPTGRCSCSSLEAANLLFVIGGVAQGPSSAVEALCLQEGV